MATQLFFLDAMADVHLGTDNASLNGAGSGWGANPAWDSRALGTSRGGTLLDGGTLSVTGPTAGEEARSPNVPASCPSEWITPPVSADVTISGTITLNLWSSESNMNANVAINAVIDVIRANTTTTRNSNTLVEIARTARVTEVAITTPAVNNFTVTPTSTVVNRGDRIRVRVFADDAGTMGAGFPWTFGYNGPTAAANGDSYVTFTETFSFESAPAGSQVFLTDTASSVATASVDREAWTARGSGVVNDVTNAVAGWTAPIQVTDTAGGTVVDWFTNRLQAFTLTGMAVANIRALESAATVNGSIRCEVARVDNDGTNATIWASWLMSANNARFGELGTSEAAETVNVSGDDLAISDGQRLRIRLYVDDWASAAMAAGTATVFYNGTSAAASGDSYITFAQTLTEFTAGGTTYTKAGYGKESG
jgi:hypothetical protein